MSAPPLSQARQISDVNSFYNPPEMISRPTEISSEIGEDSLTSQSISEDPRQSVSRDEVFEIAADLDSLQASYIGEDGRLTQLRAIDIMFRKMVENSSTSISEETVMLLPSMFRTLIQFVGVLQANNGQLQLANAQLQATQQTVQGREQRTEDCISSLQKDNKQLQETHRGLKSKYDDLIRSFLEVKRSYTDIKEQKDALTAELNEIKLGATSDAAGGSSKKRIRHE